MKKWLVAKNKKRKWPRRVDKRNSCGRFKLKSERERRYATFPSLREAPQKGQALYTHA